MSTVGGGRLSTSLLNEDSTPSQADGSLSLLQVGSMNQNNPMATLMRHSANDASEMSIISPRIHPGTRQDVLAALARWITTVPNKSDDPRTSKRLLWFSGSNGTGKTSIQREFAHRCHEDGRLLASFFISTPSAGKNNEKAFVLTVARQIASNIPGLWDFVSSAIQNDPDVFSYEPAEQMRCLVFEPLKRFRRYSKHNFLWKRLKASWRGHWPEKLQQCAAFNKRCDDWWTRSIIVVDGLDECINLWWPTWLIAVMWGASCHKNFPLRFVVSCPHEDSSIEQAFYSCRTICQEIGLDTYRNETKKDLAAYFHHHFARIAKEHPKAHLLPENWPKRETVDLLIAKAYLFFLYASIVIKFIDNPLRNPMVSLDCLMTSIPMATEAKHFTEIDVLFTFIFHPPEVDMALLRRLLNTILFSERAFRSTLELDEFLSLDPGSSETALLDLHPLIRVPSDTTSDSGQEIRFCHRCVIDFLISKSRSGDLFQDSTSTSMIAKTQYR